MKMLRPNEQKKILLGRLVISLLFVVCGAGLVFGDPQEVLSNTTYPVEQQEALLEIFDEARAAGLPTEALEERLIEGLSKGVVSARMEEALLSDVEYLRAARQYLLEADAVRVLLLEAAWERAANLLRSGWSSESLVLLGDICSEHPDSFREASVLVIAIIDRGVAESQAFDLVRVVVEKLRPPEFADVAALFAIAQRRRVPADRAAQIVTDGLREGRSLRQVRAVLNRTN